MTYSTGRVRARLALTCAASAICGVVLVGCTSSSPSEAPSTGSTGGSTSAGQAGPGASTAVAGGSSAPAPSNGSGGPGGSGGSGGPAAGGSGAVVHTASAVAAALTGLTLDGLTETPPAIPLGDTLSVCPGGTVLTRGPATVATRHFGGLGNEFTGRTYTFADSAAARTWVSPRMEEYAACTGSVKGPVVTLTAVDRGRGSSGPFQVAYVLVKATSPTGAYFTRTSVTIVHNVVVASHRTFTSENEARLNTAAADTLVKAIATS